MPLPISEWQKTVHTTSRNAGWWNDPETGEPIDPMSRVPETIALIHTEVSEAFEEYRNHRMDLWFSDSEIGKKPEGFGVELADTIIRCLDTAESLGIDIEALINLKNAYNKKRPYRHGGKKA